MPKIKIPKYSPRLLDILKKNGITLKDKISVEEFEREVCRFMDKNKVLHLGTSYNDIPRVTPLEYKHKGFTLYIFSEGGGKFANLRKNKNVALSIASPYDSKKDFFGAKGLQMWGRAEVISAKSSPKKFKECLQIMGIDERRLSGEFNYRVIKIEPHMIRYRNTRAGFRNVVWEK
ncbi:MAG: pyridoxamine 5'-phosphate oxidase family protein [Candidatus Schekmanbacteria bacterium]|nr:MAG: pyridoxamine 5'-phosphate oxidase family protein [Candidatus Schekmanbacteria bacterium]